MRCDGNCCDCAPTDFFFDGLMIERVHGARLEPRAQAEAELFEYVAVVHNR